MAFPLIEMGRSPVGWCVQVNGLSEEALRNVLDTIAEEVQPDGTVRHFVRTATLTDEQARNWFILHQQAKKEVPEAIERRIVGAKPTRAKGV